MERTLARRQTIYFAGDPLRQHWLLSSGSVKVIQVGPNGDEVILRIVGPGQFISSFELGSQDSYRCTAQVLQPSKALVWEAATFDSLSESIPALRRGMLRVLGELLNEMNERFREVSTEKVAPRLSSQLGRLLTQIGRRAEDGVEITLSREELAQLTGTTLFTVSRLLSRWEQQGIVRARREAVLICNSQALANLSEGT